MDYHGRLTPIGLCTYIVVGTYDITKVWEYHGSVQLFRIRVVFQEYDHSAFTELVHRKDSNIINKIRLVRVEVVRRGWARLSDWALTQPTHPASLVVAC